MGGTSMATISSRTATRALKISLSCSAVLLVVLLLAPTLNAEEAPPPMPKAWPEQFHSLMVMNNTGSGKLQIIDLWYDWPGGRNLNLIHNQLGKVLHDVEWNNGTSFFYTLKEEGNGGSSGDVECRSMHFEVGILRPNWLDGATYVGQRQIDGFLCNVRQKVDFITYHEDVVTNRPVHWVFYTGMEAHVMTFEVGAVLEDSGWQAPSYCFQGHNSLNDFHNGSSINSLPLPASSSSSSSSINRVLHGRETSAKQL